MSQEIDRNAENQSMQVYTGSSEVNVSDHASITDLEGQVQVIQQAMKSVMRVDEHYGVIPGTKKPTLLKPGAEKLSLLFRLAPKYQVERFNLPGGHREYEIRCTLVHINSGNFIGEGVGSCSTMEKKYRWRNESKKCPDCGEETIIKGKKEYGGGWLCYKKKGGCGNKWADGDKAIENQSTGQAENPDIADTYNTVLKMAKKRAHVDAILTATAASDIFTQDLEDMDLKKNAPHTENTTQTDPLLKDSPENFTRVKGLMAKLPDKHPFRKKDLDSLTFEEGKDLYGFLKMFFSVQKGLFQIKEREQFTPKEANQFWVNLMKCQTVDDLKVLIDLMPAPAQNGSNQGPPAKAQNGKAYAIQSQLEFISENLDYLVPDVQEKVEPRLAGPDEPLTYDEGAELCKTIRAEIDKQKKLADQPV